MRPSRSWCRHCRAFLRNAEPRVASDTDALQLFQRKFDSFFLFPRNEFIALDHACAGVPTEDRVVVTGWSERLRFFEPVHCFAEKIVRLEATARRVLPQFRLCAAFGHDSGIIRAVI